MPKLAHLSIDHVRNLSACQIEPSPGLNFIVGANGAGKSSVLESIHFLALGRGFYRQRLMNLIQLEQASAVCHGLLDDGSKMGVERFADGRLRLRCNETDLRSTAELLGLLPVQLINADAFVFLQGSPKDRRQFIDWGVFHVEHGFLQHWQRCQKFLRNRNELLKSRSSDKALLAAYSQNFADSAIAVDDLRQAWFVDFAPIFRAQLANFIELPGELQLVYRRGWDKTRDLADVLLDQLLRDQKLGSTQAGPQRADLVLRYRGQPVQEVLSRGQQKLIVLALKLAQIELFARKKAQTCVILLDDLAAELDLDHQAIILQSLAQLSQQVFLTSIAEPNFKGLGLHNMDSLALFHVEQGQIVKALI